MPVRGSKVYRFTVANESFREELQNIKIRSFTTFWSAGAVAGEGVGELEQRLRVPRHQILLGRLPFTAAHRHTVGIQGQNLRMPYIRVYEAYVGDPKRFFSDHHPDPDPDLDLSFWAHRS